MWCLCCRCFALLVTLLSVAWAQQPAQSFTIIALPDTQNEAQFFPAILNAQMQWIVQNQAAKNIVAVVGEGDIVNNGSDQQQWINADAAYRLLDNARIPYFAAIGNHDYDGAAPKAGRPVVGFNQWFGPARYANYPWYLGNFPAGSNENFYGVLNIGGVNYLFIALEFVPRPEAVQWAESVLAANPEKPAIIVTHSFLNSANIRPGRCENGDMLPPNETAEVMWSELRESPNLSLVLSGHFTSGLVGHRTDIGDLGNLVNQVYTDFQDVANGGNGWLRILTFTPATNSISVQTYSPWLNQSMLDAKNQYTLFMNNPQLVTGLGTLGGKVFDSSTCKPVAGASVTVGASNAISAADGSYQLIAPPTAYSLQASAPNYSPSTQSETVHDAWETHLNFYLTPTPPVGPCSLNPASPSVTICTPVNGANVPSPLSVVAGSTDAVPVTLMQAFVDGKALATSHSGTMNSSIAVSNGPHRLTVQAKDTTGAIFKQTINVTVGGAIPQPPACTVNPTSPSVTICSPVNAAVLSSPVEVVASTTDSHPISLIQIYVDGKGVFTATGGTLDHSVAMAAGPHRLTVQAKDSAGTIFKQTINITVQ
jgi:Carboxypeptidase regulatory-like domain/Calcineurin-like phosphoesterase/Bacterial Ig domain